MAKPSELTLNQRFAVGKAYLDERIPLQAIADLADINTSQVAHLARQVLGEKYFKPRFKKKPEDLLKDV